MTMMTARDKLMFERGRIHERMRMENDYLKTLDLLEKMGLPAPEDFRCTGKRGDADEMTGKSK